MRLPVTAIVAAKNESVNIQTCLESLKPVNRIIVADSNSTDGTDKIAFECGAEVVQFDFSGGYPKKRQWVIDTIDIDDDWVFMVDADEVIPSDLWDEIDTVLKKQNGPDAYLITKGFHFLGKRFRYGGFSHAAILLFRKNKGRFEALIDMPSGSQDMEVHERVVVDGKIGRLRHPLIHQDFKGLEAYIDRHNKYSTWEAAVRGRFLTTGQWGEQTIEPRLFGNAQEQRRWLKKMAMRMPFEPVLWFCFHYFFRLGFLEGRRGLIASLFRAFYITQVRAKMFELDLASDS